MKDSAFLKEVLLQEKEVLTEILSLEETTQQILIRADARELEKINREKEHLLNKMSDLEEKRQKISSGSDALSEEHALRQELRRLLAVLSRVTRINSSLLQHNLRFASRAAKVLLSSQEPLYSSQGDTKIDPSFFSGLIDSNV